MIAPGDGQLLPGNPTSADTQVQPWTRNRCNANSAMRTNAAKLFATKGRPYRFGPTSPQTPRLPRRAACDGAAVEGLHAAVHALHLRRRLAPHRCRRGRPGAGTVEPPAARAHRRRVRARVRARARGQPRPVSSRHTCGVRACLRCACNTPWCSKLRHAPTTRMCAWPRWSWRGLQEAQTPGSAHPCTWGDSMWRLSGNSDARGSVDKHVCVRTLPRIGRSASHSRHHGPCRSGAAQHGERGFDWPRLRSAQIGSTAGKGQTFPFPGL